MPRPSLRRTLTLWTLAATLACVAVVLVYSWNALARRARADGRARVERLAARAASQADAGVAPGEVADAEPGIEVVARTRAAVEAAFGDPRVAIWRAALEGLPASEVFDGEPGAVAVRPLAGDPPPGLIEVRLPASRIAVAWQGLAARAVAVALATALAAAGLALLLGRRWTRPLADLTESATRWSRGDLASPVTAVGGDEVGELATALERMRASVAASTGELTRRRGELEAVLAGIAEGVFAVDRDRRIQFLSPRAAVLLGVEAGSAIGRFCGDVLRPDAIEGERPCDGACPILEARYRGPARAVERLTPGATTFAAVLTSSPPSGGVQVQVVREETTDEAARRARDAVVADLAHELKTPLAAQRASLELLRDRLADGDSETSALAASAQSGTLRLERLIENLLESVRIESGQAALRRAEVDLEEVVEEAVSLTAPLIAKRRQRLEIDLAYPLPRPVGDSPRLVQVLVNLLSNASKFAPEESEIRLAAAGESAGIRLSVEDEGPGFDPAALSAPAVRGRRDTGAKAVSAGETGSGLGLRIARSIIERHGAALEVSRRDGRTRVGFVLDAGGSR